ncbi:MULTISPECIES: ABC transporter permease [unclassified Paenibacillus]|uniref:ABC transporter permease n=1 Tax=unclassified Paenibacillus TaxID=185978 RepID=UPI002F3EDBB6
MHKFTGTVRLFYLHMRSDRIGIMLWLAGFTVLSMTVAISLAQMFPTSVERQAIAEALKNPAMIAMIGPSEGIDNYTSGAMFGHEMILFMAIFAAIMNILLMARHTREDEEEGRLELIRSRSAGRLAQLGSACLELFAINFSLAILLGAGLSILNIEGMPIADNFLFGASLGSVGLCFAAITALIAQAAASHRSTVGISFAILGISYLFRAMTDIENTDWSSLSPLAWSYQTNVYVSPTWKPVIIAAAIAGVIGAAAFWLNHKRDLGAGVLKGRKGTARASALLKTGIGLQFRWQRTMIISWTIGFFILGASYGSIFGDLESFFQQNEMMRKMLEGAAGYSMTEQFLAVILVVMAILITVPVIQVPFRLLKEEAKGRLDLLFARPVSRYKLLVQALSISAASAVLYSIMTAAGLYAASTAVMAEPIAFGIYVKGIFAYLPAILFIVGLTALIIGAAPQWKILVWGYLIVTFFIDYLGNLLNLPEWFRKLSVFHYAPRIPVEEVNVPSLLLTLLLTAGLIALGTVRYRRRDVYM